jgi:hypothetical protein
MLSMPDQFQINVCVAILSTNIPQNKKYILSTDEKTLKLPQFLLNSDNINNISESIYEYISPNLVVSPIELRPSLLSINSINIPKELRKTNVVNILYGSVIVFTTNIKDLYWQEFDFLLPHPYTNLLMEVVQNLS